MMFDTTTEIDLTRFEPAFQASKTETKTNVISVPDGTYRVSIEDLTLANSPTTGNPTLKWMLRILGPTQQRRLIYKWNGISEKSLPYLVEELKRCGVELQKFSDLEKHLPSMIGLEVEIAKKTRGERSNIYINKLLSAKAAFVAEDDDLPF